MAEITMADVLGGMAYQAQPPEQPWPPPSGSTFFDRLKGAMRQDPGAVFTTGAAPFEEVPLPKDARYRAAELSAGRNRFDPLELIVGLGGGASGGALAGMPPLSFSERMALGRDLAARDRPAYTTARAPAVSKEFSPLLRPDETKEDVMRAVTGEPAAKFTEPSLAEQAREAYRSKLDLDAGPIIGAGAPDRVSQLIRPTAAQVEAVKAPYIRKADAPLFDYRNLHEVPDVPQFYLPRNVPREIPPDIQRALREGNIERVNEIVRQGMKEGGLEWYNTMPLKDVYQEYLGTKAGIPAYTGYIKAVGATSPDMAISPNIRTASYYDFLLRNNEPLPTVRIKRATGNPYVPEGEIPNPYGSRAQALHVQNMQNIRDFGSIPVLDNPKPPSFTENLLGNYLPVAVDRHNLTLWGVNRAKPGPGYDPLESVQQQQALRMGIMPAQYQASGWLPYGSSGNMPFLRLLEDRIATTAEQRGLTKLEALKQFLKAQAPLR